MQPLLINFNCKEHGWTGIMAHPKLEWGFPIGFASFKTPLSNGGVWPSPSPSLTGAFLKEKSTTAWIPGFLSLMSRKLKETDAWIKDPVHRKACFFFDRPILACQGAVFLNRKRGSTAYCILWCWWFFISLFNRVRLPEFIFFREDGDGRYLLISYPWGEKNKSDLSNGLNPLLWLHPFTSQQFLQGSFLKGI